MAASDQAQQATYGYIRDYYARVQEKNARWPDVSEFWLSKLAWVEGDAVINFGCGPLFYDNFTRFARPPNRYVGLDVNAATFDFLAGDAHPALVAARAETARAGAEVELICADVFERAGRLGGPFDAALGVGFFGVFSGAPFARLTRIAHDALRPGGRLLKLTWHGPRRTEAETRDKLRFRYDSPEEPTPDELIEGFEAAGFALDRHEIREVDAADIGFERIQACLFARPETPRAPGGERRDNAS